MTVRYKKRNRPSTFWVVYVALIVIYLIALFIVLGVIKNKLTGYEASRPYNYMDRIMTEYFAPGKAEALLDASGYEANAYETKESVVPAVEGYLSAGTEYYPVVSSVDEEVKYAVKSGELKIATVTLAPTGEHDSADYDVYGMKSVELLIGGTGAVNVRAPSDDTVYLNGVALGADLIVDREETEKDLHLPDNIPPVSFVTYEVQGLISKPTVTATDKFGAPVEAESGDDGIFYDVPLTYASVTAEVSERALAAGEALAAYMQLDSPFGRIAQYVDPTSDLYYDLATSDVKWANPHEGYGIESPSVTEYYIWSDTVYSCRVKFTHVLYRWDGNFNNDFDMTFYYTFNGAEWLIYDSKVN